MNEYTMSKPGEGLIVYRGTFSPLCMLAIGIAESEVEIAELTAQGLYHDARMFKAQKRVCKAEYKHLLEEHKNTLNKGVR
jgi:hypothetical protein